MKQRTFNQESRIKSSTDDYNVKTLLSLNNSQQNWFEWTKSTEFKVSISLLDQAARKWPLIIYCLNHKTCSVSSQSHDVIIVVNNFRCLSMVSKTFDFTEKPYK